MYIYYAARGLLASYGIIGIENVAIVIIIIIIIIINDHQ